MSKFPTMEIVVILLLFSLFFFRSISPSPTTNCIPRNLGKRWSPGTIFLTGSFASMEENLRSRWSSLKILEGWSISPSLRNHSGKRNERTHTWRRRKRTIDSPVVALALFCPETRGPFSLGHSCSPLIIHIQLKLFARVSRAAAVNVSISSATD